MLERLCVFGAEVLGGCLSEGELGRPRPGEGVGAGEAKLGDVELAHEEEAGAEVDCCVDGVGGGFHAEGLFIAGLVEFGGEEVGERVSGCILDDLCCHLEDVCMGADADVYAALTRESLCSRSIVVLEICFQVGFFVDVGLTVFPQEVEDLGLYIIRDCVLLQGLVHGDKVTKLGVSPTSKSTCRG